MMMVSTSEGVIKIIEFWIYFEELGDKLDVECGGTRGIKNNF